MNLVRPVISFAVLAYFDPETERAIRSLQEQLVWRGIQPIPEEMHREPHLTLGMWNGKAPPDFPDALLRFTAELGRMRLLFSSAGVFPTRDGVIFLAPVVTFDLLALHTRFHRTVVPAGLEPNRHYLPGAWVPHCTLGVALADWEMHAAMDIAREPPMPFEGTLESIGIVEFPPLKEVLRIPLPGPGGVPAGSGPG